jgi:hypothetical protein
MSFQGALRIFVATTWNLMHTTRSEHGRGTALYVWVSPDDDRAITEVTCRCESPRTSHRVVSVTLSNSACNRTQRCLALTKLIIFKMLLVANTVTDAILLGKFTARSRQKLTIRLAVCPNVASAELLNEFLLNGDTEEFTVAVSDRVGLCSNCVW